MVDCIRGKVAASGRVVLPAELRKAFGIEDGDEVLFAQGEYGIQVTPLSQAVRRAQEVVRQYVPDGADLVEESRQTRSGDTTFG